METNYGAVDVDKPRQRSAWAGPDMVVTALLGQVLCMCVAGSGIFSQVKGGVESTSLLYMICVCHGYVWTSDKDKHGWYLQ